MVRPRRDVAAPDRPPGCARLVGLSLACALALTATSARADGPSAEVVAVLAAHDSRLADEIRRELESSKFEVLSADLGGRRWQDVARLVDRGRLPRGVAVEPNDRTLTVYTRQTGGNSVDIRLVLSVDPGDRMARRHACLSVVEFLHALSESDLTGSEATQGASAESGTRAASGAPPRTRAGIPARASSAPPSKLAADTAETAKPSPAAGPGTTAAGPSAATPATTASLPAGGPPVPPLRNGGWQLGVATTFDLETGAGEPTSHLQFLARFPLGRHVFLAGRILWPLLAAQYRTLDSDIRSWTFGTGLSLQYAFAPGARLRPYLGVGIGARFGLTEATPLAAAQSDQSLNVSGAFGIEVGVRYAIRPLLEVFFQLEAARNWLIPPPDKGDVGRDSAANGEVARASIGITFES